MHDNFDSVKILFNLLIVYNIGQCLQVNCATLHRVKGMYESCFINCSAISSSYLLASHRGNGRQQMLSVFHDEFCTVCGFLQESDALCSLYSLFQKGSFIHSYSGAYL